MLQNLLIHLLSLLEGIPLSVPGVSKIFSGIPPFVPIFSYGISPSGVQTLSTISPCVDLLPVRLTILLFTLGIVMSFDHQKRFIHLGLLKINRAIS